MAVVPVALTAAVVTVLVGARQIALLQRVRNSTVYGLVVRGAWLSIAVVGLIAVVNDVYDIA